MRCRFFITLILISTWPVEAAAACSGTLRGNSAKFGITISDGGCEHQSTMIFATPYREVEGGLESLEPLSPVPFDSECKFEEGVGIDCKEDGVSPLAGARYKATNDTNPLCGGDRGVRYTCTYGCESGAPPFLYWEPYEC